MNPQPPSRWLLAFAIFVVVALQVIWLLLVLTLNFGENFLLKGNMAPRGQFGDLFGGVTALFTGLAFAGVVFTIALQRYDLRTQGDELRKAARLSAMATLADIYTRQIDVMERGKLRTHLWKAENAMHSLAEKEKQKYPGLGEEEAKERVMNSPEYKSYMDVAGKHKDLTFNGSPNLLFQTSFEEGRRYHRDLDHLSSDLERDLTP